jgi:hypothetical protein
VLAFLSSLLSSIKSIDLKKYFFPEVGRLLGGFPLRFRKFLEELGGLVELGRGGTHEKR